MLTNHTLEYLSERAKESEWHKDAFNCKKCPKDGCPAWWDFKWTMKDTELNVHSEKNIEGCGFTLQPIFIADMIINTYHQRDAISQVKDGFDEVAGAIGNHTDQMKKGLLAMMKLIGAKDVQRLVLENKELKKQLTAEIEEEK